MSKKRVSFFMPDWDDRVDPNFNFGADEFSEGRNVEDDVYAHEIFSRSPYDGILVSRAVVEKSQRRFARLVELGAKDFFRLPGNMKVFGDCGAFSYVNEPEPLYDVEDVLDYYDAAQVDFGASVDHLVVGSIVAPDESGSNQAQGVPKSESGSTKRELTSAEKEERVSITLQNAAKFKRLHSRRRYDFEPVGVAQGWDSESYADSVRDLIRMGYRRVALGGLARSNAAEIRRVLERVNSAIDEFPKSGRSVSLHLFGVAKLSLAREFRAFRVSSIDSASLLRKAWLRSGQNYLASDGRWYTAIRVPQSGSQRVRGYLERNGHSEEDTQRLEAKILSRLEEFGRGIIGERGMEGLLDDVVEYDSYMIRNGSDGVLLRQENVAREKYKRTLEARPWEKCHCKICRGIGIHVLIFRGTNRNKRRGFHNTWTFCQELRRQGNSECPDP